MSGGEVAGSGWTRALVVFSGRTDLVWLRLLRPGFRHCFAVLGSAGGWICVNPMAHGTEISVLPVAPDFDLAGWYRSQGLICVSATPRRPPRRAIGWRPYTCVEEVKRVIGLSGCAALTPWQLYLSLSKNGKSSLTPGGKSA
ncbi:hypothetical protein [Paramagnetospirillum marisnigri]|uniref:hypothetical protein n=1 Tax=Paramagnetospirillum marisnigri TaxID=1285242 RepID=UPI0009ED626D|nr:hypothetical protein [Paramagnetospirillum marisnigri]